MSEMRIWWDVPYADADAAQRLHLCVPAQDRNAPLVVFIHGGGWSGGSINQYLPHIVMSASVGFAAATVEYRLAPKTPFPEQIYDVARACAWLRANAARHGFDGSGMATLGSSAGGHLALVVAARAEDFPRLGVCGQLPTAIATVAQCPATNMDAARAKSANSIRQVARHGCPLEECSPQHIEPSKFPALLVQHGDADTSIPLDESREFISRLKAAGHDAELRVLAGVAHAFGYRHAFPVGADNLQAALEFFGKRFGRALPTGSVARVSAKPDV